MKIYSRVCKRCGTEYYVNVSKSRKTLCQICKPNKTKKIRFLDTPHGKMLFKELWESFLDTGSLDMSAEEVRQNSLLALELKKSRKVVKDNEPSTSKSISDQ